MAPNITLNDCNLSVLLTNKQILRRFLRHSVELLTMSMWSDAY